MRLCSNIQLYKKNSCVAFISQSVVYVQSVDHSVGVHHSTAPLLSHRFEIKEANLPSDIMQVCRGHVTELARQCVEPPLRRKPT